MCQQSPAAHNPHKRSRITIARPLKWSRDLHLLRERATRSRTETWARKDIERLFEVGRATAQGLMKAIGPVQSVGGAHFLDRAALLAFLDAMILAPSVEDTLRERVLEAEAPPVPRPLRVSLPQDLRNLMLRDLPANIALTQGHLEITAASTESLLESLVLLSQALTNDLERIRTVFDPPPQPPAVDDARLQSFLTNARRKRT